MDDTEQEHFHDDHVEITDLPEETEAAGRLRTSRGKAGIAPPFLVKWLFRRPISHWPIRMTSIWYSRWRLSLQCSNLNFLRIGLRCLLTRCSWQ